jgi:hypothetical protein
MNKKIICTALLACGLSFSFMHSSVCADDDEFSRTTMLILRGVYVVVDELNFELAGDGLSKNGLKAVAEAKLREAGIEILPVEDREAAGTPHLHIHPEIVRGSSSQEYIYHISVQLRQSVFLSRTPVIEALGTTWSTTAMGVAASASDVQDKVKDLIDQFINAYYTVNPR